MQLIVELFLQEYTIPTLHDFRWQYELILQEYTIPTFRMLCHFKI